MIRILNDTAAIAIAVTKALIIRRKENIYTAQTTHSVPPLQFFKGSVVSQYYPDDPSYPLPCENRFSSVKQTQNLSEVNLSHSWKLLWF